MLFIYNLVLVTRISEGLTIANCPAIDPDSIIYAERSHCFNKCHIQNLLTSVTYLALQVHFEQP